MDGQRPSRKSGDKSGRRRQEGAGKGRPESAKRREERANERRASTEPRSGERRRQPGAPAERSSGEKPWRSKTDEGRPGSREKREAPGGRSRAPVSDAPLEGGFGPYAKPPRERPRRGDEEVVRSAAVEAVARAAGEREVLRVVRRPPGEQGEGLRPAKKPRKPAAERAPANGERPAKGPRYSDVPFLDVLQKAGRALERGYERDAVRYLKPVAEVHPENADIREMLGLAYYRLDKWTLAEKELLAFIQLTDSVEQHPVLMDCYRALKRYRKVADLWDELKTVSPAKEIIAEGRIVAAGALADQGKLKEAIDLLDRGNVSPKRLGEHHLRLWYALADLRERAGDLPGARTLFRKVSTQDPTFFDVAERLSALS